MTVADCEQRVLQLLDEVGVTDYNDRMYRLIDLAQREIATQWGFIEKRVILTAEDKKTVPLPDDFYAISRVKGGSYEEDLAETENGFVSGITLWGSENGAYSVYYKAYPKELLEDNTNEKIQLSKKYHNALCFRVAALTRDRELESEARAYNVFMQQYNDQISMLERAKNMTKKARVIIRGRNELY